MPRARPLRFFLIAAASFALCYALAAAGIGFLLHWPSADPPPGYGTLLLRDIPGPRIIVDSGSSSTFSIIPAELERRYGRRVVVSADTAGVPFEARLRRLERFVVPGDVVLMPLEWIYYFQPYVSWGAFGASAFDPVNDYYRMLGFWRQIDIAARHLGFRDVLRGLRAEHRKTLRDVFSRDLIRQYSLARLRQHLAANPAGDRVGLVAPRTSFGGCRSYLLYDLHAATPTLEEIADGLARLQRSNGATVIITWPAVVGGNCYDANPGASPAVVRIREAFERRGIKTIGDPLDSAFPESAMVDTYYHVNKEAAAIRTQRLIARLDEARVMTPGPAPHPPTPALAAAALAAAEERFLRDRLLDMGSLRSGHYAVKTGEFDRNFIRTDGWYTPEFGLVWSRGPESTFWLPPVARACRMKFERNMLGVPDSLISIGDGEGQMESGQWLTVGPTAQPVRVRLHHRNIASPYERRQSDDRRPIHYGLLAVTVACEPM